MTKSLQCVLIIGKVAHTEQYIAVPRYYRIMIKLSRRAQSPLSYDGGTSMGTTLPYSKYERCYTVIVRYL